MVKKNSFLKSYSDMTNKNAYPQKSCSWMFMATLLTIGNTYNIILIIDNTCKQHQYSVTGEWWYIKQIYHKQIVVYP